MRYEPINTISFINKNGVTVNIKDIREYPPYETYLSLNIKAEDKIDEIATRFEIYGDEAEGESYKIIDNNIIKLFEANFKLDKIKKLDIPL
jgi:hypothetical protein